MDSGKYFTWKRVTFNLSPCDADILLYAINHVNWREYDAECFGGEGDAAAGEHLCWFENALNEAFENLPYNENYGY